jgi:hypothetical protein
VHNKASSQSGDSGQQTGTGFIKPHTPQPSIQIDFTDQKLSGRAGLLTFAGFRHWHRFAQLLARVLPPQRTRKRALPVTELALGLLAGAQKLAQVASLRSDVLDSKNGRQPDGLPLAQPGHGERQGFRVESEPGSASRALSV